MLPPGRARLAIRPVSTGSPLRLPMTIGIVPVACLAAKLAGEPEARMSSTFRATSSAARSGSRSLRPSEKRYSIFSSGCVSAANDATVRLRAGTTASPTVARAPRLRMAGGSLAERWNGHQRSAGRGRELHRRPAQPCGERADQVASDRRMAEDRDAGGVAHDQHDLRAGYLAAELHAPEDVVADDVAGHAGVENVADAEIHDRLGGRAGVDAAQEHRGRVLSLRARFLLSQVVLRCLLPRSEALIAVLHELDDLVRRQLVALRLGQCGCPGNPARERGANEGDRAGDFEECSAAETLQIAHVDSPRSSLVARTRTKVVRAALPLPSILNLNQPSSTRCSCG